MHPTPKAINNTKEARLEVARVQKCQVCKKNRANYAVQIIGGEVSAYSLGWHIRGFPMIKVCDGCLEETKAKLEKKLQEEEQNETTV